jgi:hypothetical protein
MAAVVAFPAHVVVAAPVERAWLDSWVVPHDYSAPLPPRFLDGLEDRLRLGAGALDVVLLPPPALGPPRIELQPRTAVGHPRVARAHRFRTDVHAWTTPAGILVVGRRGLGGRGRRRSRCTAGPTG